MKKINFYLIIVIFQVALVWKYCESIACDITPKNTEGRLQQHLLCSYDQTIRPVGDSKNKTTVKIKLVVKSFDFDDAEGKLTINSWMSMRWTDEHLKWNRKDFDNLESVNINGHELWMPDLAIYNSKTTQFYETCTTAHCVVYYNGIITCIPPCSHEGICKSDYTNWPFDTQNCSLHLGSWVHKGEEIDYQSQRIAIEATNIQHKEWKIISTSVRKNRGNYSCCPGETYPSLQYNFLIERHSAAECAFILSPALILASMNLITLWLNPNSSERIIMCVVAIFSHFIFIQQLSWMVPKNGNNVPNAIIFFRDSLIISAVLILNTIVMRGLLACKTSIPGWIKTTTETLKGNKIGQMIFSNPYLINSTPLNNDNITDDSSNLIEGGGAQLNEEVQVEKSNGKNVWSTAVKVFDTLVFLALLVAYVLMLIGWIPETYKNAGSLNAEVYSDSD